MALFSIKKHLKVLIKKLKVKNILSTVHNCPTINEVVDNTIGVIDIFKK